jgi:proteasome lid subunit RPN8/RPN11
MKEVSLSTRRGCWPTGPSKGEIVSWVRCHRGEEVCGLLGKDSTGELHFVGLHNSTGLPNHCEITRKEWSRVLECLRIRGWEPVAFVHSHLGPPVPSATDLENSHGSDLPWVIVSSAGEGIAALASAQVNHRDGDFSFFAIHI